MRVGIFADVHDHLDNARRAVACFNERQCELVLFAGDLVSPLVVPALRDLNCPLAGCFGDNDGNRRGITGGMRIVGPLGEPPLGLELADGTRVLVTHQLEQLVGLTDGAHVVVSAHTHRAKVTRRDDGLLLVNPGETSGWTTRQPTVAILETRPLAASIVNLPMMPLPADLPVPPRFRGRVAAATRGEHTTERTD